MATEEIDKVREQIWDFIFCHGQQSPELLAEKLELPIEQILVSVDSDWFVVEGGEVFIATGSN